MKEVLVFGGSGFLGEYLAKELIKKKYNVTIADLKPGHPKCNFIKCDILSDNDLDLVFKNHYDYVFNLAGFANLEDAIEQPIIAMKLNLISNMSIIELCIKNDIKKYVYASSSYAMSIKGSFYGISKLASEKVIEEYHEKHNLNFAIIRYGSVYSEKKFHNNYIYNLIEKSIKSGVIEHNGNGEEFREYIHAKDAAKLSVDVIESDKFLNSHVLLTGNHRIKRIDLFNIINEISGSKLNIKLNINNKNDHYKYTPYSFQPSYSQKLIPNPEIDLGQGILETIRNIHDKK
jgi:UDP-glucose 4-epimerase